MSIDPAHELMAEQAYLTHARAELARMREHTLSLEARGGDQIAEEHLAGLLRLRAAALSDDRSTSLFFGRLDMATRDGEGDGPTRWYVGRRHVSDGAGDPVVVDWRAQVSTAFYRASPAAPMGVRLRRRFGVEGGELTAYEDEHLTAPQAGDATGHSKILATEIERPRSGPMRDIVATIQPEQDEIVRSEVSRTVCVQGAPGTGKTAVGLHRAAWLLYAYRERLARSGVLVIGPSRTFLEHVGAVLPSLGEVSVRHTTIDELTAAVQVRAQDPPAVAVLKGDARMAQMLHRAVWAGVGAVTEPLVLPRGSRTWRVPAYEVTEIVDELCARSVRYAAAQAMLPRRLAHAVLLRMERSGDSPDDRVQDAIARSAPVRAHAKNIWPPVDPPRVLCGLWSSPQTLAAAAGDLLSEDEQRALIWQRTPRSPGSARWTPADAVLLDELTDLVERTPSLGHIVLDEAQDLSPMQLRAVGRRCSTGSATVLGDIAQGTTPWSTTSWEESLTHLGAVDAHLEALDRGFRVPRAVLDYAARLLPTIAPALSVPRSVRDDPGRLDVHAVPEAITAVAPEITRVSVHPGTIGVIVAERDVPAVTAALQASDTAYLRLGDTHDEELPGSPPRVQVVPATLAKGLEFDQVIVVEPAAIVAAEPDERTGLRRLYVVLTRAVSGLTVLHAEPLPEPLRADPS
ncbi:MAG: AAA family ATPase, partial [Actinobacteria bacterium]|nr:AAA family ATPase [Actinomycetota bacterium]